MNTLSASSSSLAHLVPPVSAVGSSTESSSSSPLCKRVSVGASRVLSEIRVVSSLPKELSGIVVSYYTNVNSEVQAEMRQIATQAEFLSFLTQMDSEVGSVVTTLDFQGSTVVNYEVLKQTPQKFPNVTRLNLADCAFLDSEQSLTEALSGWNQLRELSLQNTPVVDRGLVVAELEPLFSRGISLKIGVDDLELGCLSKALQDPVDPKVIRAIIQSRSHTTMDLLKALEHFDSPSHVELFTFLCKQCATAFEIHNERDSLMTVPFVTMLVQKCMYFFKKILDSSSEKEGGLSLEQIEEQMKLFNLQFANPLDFLLMMTDQLFAKRTVSPASLEKCRLFKQIIEQIARNPWLNNWLGIEKLKTAQDKKAFLEILNQISSEHARHITCLFLDSTLFIDCDILRQISQKLPNITSLSLGDLVADTKQFIKSLENWNHLKKLSIGGTLVLREECMEDMVSFAPLFSKGIKVEIKDPDALLSCLTIALNSSSLRDDQLIAQIIQSGSYSLLDLYNAIDPSDLVDKNWISLLYNHFINNYKFDPQPYSKKHSSYTILSGVVYALDKKISSASDPEKRLLFGQLRSKFPPDFESSIRQETRRNTLECV